MTAINSIRSLLDASQKGRLASAFQMAAFGTGLRKIKATITPIAPAAAMKLTAFVASEVSVAEGPKPVRDSGVLPAIGRLRSLRAVANTATGADGTYVFGDHDAAPVTANAGARLGIVTLDDDDATITFPVADVTSFVIEYYAAPGSFFYAPAGRWVSVDIDAVGVDVSPALGPSEGIGS